MLVRVLIVVGYRRGTLRRSPGATLAVAVLSALVLSGCEPGMPAGPARGRIDEERGSYAGLSLGVPRTEVLLRLGRPVRYAAAPAVDHGEAGPRYLPSDSTPAAIYADADFSFVARRASAFVIYGRGARTDRGIGIGDPLVRAGERYRATCQPETGGEFGPYSPRCEVRVRRALHLFFGGDPIEVIAVSTEAFGERGEPSR
jgi:hypothetical protein